MPKLSKPLRFTLTELCTIITLVQERQEDGSYYGVKHHYQERLKKIRAKLEKEADDVRSKRK